MMWRFHQSIGWLLCLVAVWLCWSAPLSSASTPTSLVKGSAAKASERIALLIGHNKGHGQLKPLQFAQQDAQKLATLLIELGGYRREQVNLLLSPTREQLVATMKRIKKRIDAMKGRGTFFFYYSGHARGKTFQLGAETISFQSIWRFVKGLRVKVRVMLIDSCFAGRFLQSKGPKRLTNIEWVPPVEQKNHGVVVLASSGANGRSYESSLIKGSLFTSSVLAGLRGAADKNSDLQVSLAELWQYVYKRTLVRSSDLHANVQRPSHRIELQGQGPLILSVLSKAGGQVVFPASMAGHIFVYRKGTLLQDVHKQQTKRLRLGLQSGRYLLHIRHNGKMGHYRLQLARRERHQVRVAQIRWRALSSLQQSKGELRLRKSSFRVGLLANYQPLSYLASHGTGLSLSLDSGRWLRADIGYAYGLGTPFGTDYQVHTMHLRLAVGYGLTYRAYRFWLGGMLTPQMAIRRYPTKEHWNMGLIAGALAHFDLLISPTLSLRLAASGGVNAMLFAGNAWLTSPSFGMAMGVMWAP